MLRGIVFVTMTLVASPTTAQLNLPTKLTYVANEGVPTELPPAAAIEEPSQASQDNFSLVPYVTTANPTTYRAVSDTSSGGNDEAKFRITFGPPTFVDYVDQLRGPGKRPFSHLHTFFCATRISQNIATYSQLRGAARFQNAASKVACKGPGDLVNGSPYWIPALIHPDALGDGIARVKPWDIVTFYYSSPEKPSFTKNLVEFRRGFGMIGGMNMDDPDQHAFRAKVQAQANAKPSLLIITPTAEQLPHGTWRCENSGTGYPALANYDGTPMFICPTDQHLLLTIVSNTCWNGQLRAPDGFSNTVPAVHFSSDGKKHCPLEYRYRILDVVTIFRFSHRGSDDYRRWRFASDDHAGMLAGRQMRNGETAHTDVIFGWDQRISDRWQCNIGLQIASQIAAGKTCTPHDMNFDTIGPNDQGVVERLIKEAVPNSGGKPLVDLGNTFKGDKASDWLAVPATNLP